MPYSRSNQVKRLNSSQHADPKSIHLDSNLILPQQQKIWGRLAVVNFTFGSAGAAFYLISVLLQILTPDSFNLSLSVLRLVAPSCVGFGLLAVAVEAGRPLRARFLMGNLRKSWMARETLGAIVFIPLSLVSAPGLISLAAGAGMFFILAQAFIIYRSRAIPAWNVPMLPASFVCSALTAGCGLLFMFAQSVNIAVLLLVSVCVSADLVCWALYLYWPASDLVEAATESQRKPRALLSIVVLGRVLPMLLLLLVLPEANTTTASHYALNIIGLALFAGSYAQRTAIIRRCGYLSPIRLQLRLQPSAVRRASV